MDGETNTVELFLSQWVEKYKVSPSRFNAEELRAKIATLLENHPVDTITNVKLDRVAIETLPLTRILHISFRDDTSEKIEVCETS